MNKLKKNYSAIVMVSIALTIWELLVRILEPPKWIIPAPTSIFIALYKEFNILMENTWVTFSEAILGFGIAIVFSVILAIIMDLSPFIRNGIYPILVASQTIPIFAIAPLLIIWFGFGALPKILIVALVDFFPIVVNLVDGLNSADKGLIKLLKTMNASNSQILRKIRFPSALPYFFSGLKIAATYSVMGAIIGEWLGASKGLGLYIKVAFNSFLTDQVFAAIIVIVIISTFLYGIIILLERYFVPWNKEETKNIT